LFFKAEDGIRDRNVTGVQTCALPIFRFNINAFKNDYSLADLSKMNLTYYGVQVGTCKQRELGIDKEFEFQNKPAEVTAESILGADGETQKQEDSLAVYDIVLAGVKV